jgi:hypothetical protein
MFYFHSLVFVFFVVAYVSEVIGETKTQPDYVIESTHYFKRATPKEVPPVVVGNIEYSASMNEVIAKDTLTKDQLWIKEIYPIKFNKRLERDVQEVYIDSLSYHDSTLLIRNENSHYYSLDLYTREVTKR